jgi:allantoin racemase
MIFPDEGTFWVEQPTEFDFLQVMPYIVKRIVKAERDGFDAALVNCIIDPGVDAARCVVDIPVLGPGRTAIHVASMLADKIGFFCPSKLVPHLYRFASSYGLSHFLHYVEPVDLGPTDFSDKKKAIEKGFRSFAQRAVNQGAQAAIPWGLPLLSAGGLDAKKLSKELKILVLDPHIYVRMAEALVHMDITHSRLSYPSPPLNQIDSLLTSL